MPVSVTVDVFAFTGVCAFFSYLNIITSFFMKVSMVI